MKRHSYIDYSSIHVFCSRSAHRTIWNRMQTLQWESCSHTAGMFSTDSGMVPAGSGMNSAYCGRNPHPMATFPHTAGRLSTGYEDALCTLQEAFPHTLGTFSAGCGKHCTTLSSTQASKLYVGDEVCMHIHVQSEQHAWLSSINGRYEGKKYICRV